MTTLRIDRTLLVGLATGALLIGCAGQSSGSSRSDARRSGSTVRSVASAASATTSTTAGTSSTAPARRLVDPTVTGVVAKDLGVPWGIAFLPSGSALVSGRDNARIVRVKPSGAKKRIGTVGGVVSNGSSGGEAGLLGLAVAKNVSTTHWLYAYLSTASDNRIVRMKYRHAKLGPTHVVLKGIPKGLHHNGGRIAFGPDGMLYATTGESGDGALAQTKKSLGGKILRMTPGGNVPASGNPWKDSLVYSWGHRNVEGLAWDSAGRLWATEFGDKGWDELNLILPGRNYGWPATEGRTSNSAYTSPKAQWHTYNAGPSGIAIIDDVAYIGGLTGHRLWRVRLDGTSVAGKKSFLTERYGRLRTAAAAPDGSLWLTSSNTDGRATAGAHDDRIFRVRVS